MKRALTLLLCALAGGPALAQPQAQTAPAVTLQAFDCGQLKQQDLHYYSDTMHFDGQKRDFAVGCFLIRHPKGVLLWDTGLDPDRIGKDELSGAALEMRIAERLRSAKIDPAAVTHIGISHYHFDHTGGARDLPGAELLIGKGDWEALKARPADSPAAAALSHWLSGKGRVRPVSGDLDLFGDGSVVMLTMPGHTPGHSALLVRLPKSGAVLLSGDQYHFRENRAAHGVPGFNTDRADTLASHDRFEEIAKNLKARVVIQHDSRDLAELPAFPAALD